MPEATITVRVSDALKASVERVATEHGFTLTGFVTRALEDAVLAEPALGASRELERFLAAVSRAAPHIRRIERAANRLRGRSSRHPVRTSKERS